MSLSLSLAILIALQSPSSGSTIELPGVAPVAQFDHISLHVADVERSAFFYKNVLGLTEITSPVAGLRWFDAGNGTQLHLLPKRQLAVADVRQTHFAFAVVDLDQFVARLNSTDISWWSFAGEEKVLSHRGDGVRQIYIRDPDGYWIELNDHRNLP